MERSDIILAAMAAAAPPARFDLVQIQMLLFLIDREVGVDIGGPDFNFRPHHYGPFDPGVFDDLERLVTAGKVAKDTSGPCEAYCVAAAGQGAGQAALGRMARRASRYARKAALWVLSQPFWDLVSGIHRAYPETAVNGPMLLAAIPDPCIWAPRTMHPFLAGMAMAVSFPGRLRRGRAPHPQGSTALVASDWRAVGDDLRRAMQRWAADPAQHQP